MPGMNSPEWLIGESVDGMRQFVIHCWPPRFMAEILDNDEGGNDITDFDFIDEPPKINDADKYVMYLAKLARQAGDAVVEYDRRLAEDMEKKEDG